MADIVAFAASTREGSHNQRLLRSVAERVEEAGATVTLIDLRGFPMPLYDADLETREGIPASVSELKKLIGSHRGLLVASPEYNSAYSPLLKNIVDWTSRSEGDEPPCAVYANKVAGLVSASPGGLGGLRGLVVLRMLLQNIGVTVLPEQLALPAAHDAYADDGSLVNTGLDEMASRIAARLAVTVAKLSA